MATFQQTTTDANDCSSSDDTDALTDVYIGKWNAAAGDYDTAGFRYTNVTIPQGATINSASISMTAQAMTEGSLGNIDVDIYGEDVDNAAAWSLPGTRNPRDAMVNTTTATTSWTPSASSGTVTTPSLAAIIQEIVNRPGWASGNALVILIDAANQVATDDELQITNATAQLNVDYTAGGGAGTAAVTGTATDAGTSSQDLRDTAGKTFIATLTDDTFIGSFTDTDKLNLLNGLVAAVTQTNGWNNQRANIDHTTAVVRTSGTVATITLPALPGLHLDHDDILEWTIPGSVLTGGSPIVATPTIRIGKKEPDPFAKVVFRVAS